jgi:hypothetical protein
MRYLPGVQLPVNRKRCNRIFNRQALFAVGGTLRNIFRHLMNGP